MSDISKNSSNSDYGSSSALEKEDMKKVNNVRTKFYALNEKFEHLLKFKPIKKLQLWHVEFNLASSYHIFQSLKIEEKFYSMAD